MLDMRNAYKYLAYTVVVLIFVQAAAIAWAIFGESKFIENGGTVNKALQESDELPFPEVVGFIVHGINGEMLIPLVSLVLLILSFFAHVPEGTKWAGMLLGGIVVQVLLGVFGSGLPLLGVFHGATALLLVLLALRAARQAGPAAGVAEPAGAAAVS